MKKIISSLLLVQILVSSSAQQKGIVFEHGKSWSEIKAQAKAEKKHIFVDAFTTWCGPCKAMSNNIFPLEEVGKFYNEHFINVKAQLDTTAADSEEVKQRYKDAHDLMVTYDVAAFPTFLFFNPDGEIVHRSVGSSDAEHFIGEGQKALDPEKQYYALKKRYEQGHTDTAFLRILAHASSAAYDREFSKKVINHYLSTQNDLFTNENLRFLEAVTEKTSDRGFAIFRNNGKKVDSALGEGRSGEIVRDIVSNEIVYPFIYPKGTERAEHPDWKELEKTLKKDYADISEEIILTTKARHYLRFSNWPEFSKAVNAFIKRYSDKVPPYELNNFAWAVFERCDDVQCLQSALDWSKRSLNGEHKKNTMFMDTYANLLYKLGRKDEAIAIQSEAVQLAGESAGDLRTTLDKMKRGEKTWN